MEGTAALEVGEVVLDGVEVGAIGRQGLQVMACVFDESLGRGMLMESGIVPDGHLARIELREQEVAQPEIDDLGVGGTLEQHGREEPACATRGDQAGARATVAGAQTINPLAARGVTMGTRRFAFEAAFVDIDQPIVLSGERDPGAPFEIFSAALSEA